MKWGNALYNNIIISSIIINIPLSLEKSGGTAFPRVPPPLHHCYKEVRNVFRVITDLDVLDADQIRELPLALAKKYVADLEPGVFPEI
jgi:hypothetical protein